MGKIKSRRIKKKIKKSSKKKSRRRRFRSSRTPTIPEAVGSGVASLAYMYGTGPYLESMPSDSINKPLIFAGLIASSIAGGLVVRGVKEGVQRVGNWIENIRNPCNPQFNLNSDEDFEVFYLWSGTLSTYNQLKKVLDDLINNSSKESNVLAYYHLWTGEPMQWKNWEIYAKESMKERYITEEEKKYSNQEGKGLPTTSTPFIPFSTKFLWDPELVNFSEQNPRGGVDIQTNQGGFCVVVVKKSLESQNNTIVDTSLDVLKCELAYPFLNKPYRTAEELKSSEGGCGYLYSGEDDLIAAIERWSLPRDVSTPFSRQARLTQRGQESLVLLSNEDDIRQLINLDGINYVEMLNDFDESTAHELYKDGYDPSRRGNARLWPLYNWRYDEMVFIHHPKNSRKTPDSYLPRFSSHMKDEQIGQEIFEYRVMDTDMVLTLLQYTTNKYPDEYFHPELLWKTFTAKFPGAEKKSFQVLAQAFAQAGQQGGPRDEQIAFYLGQTMSNWFLIQDDPKLCEKQLDNLRCNLHNFNALFSKEPE